MATINPRYFSIAEANALLKTLTPLLEELITRRDKVAYIQQNQWGRQLDPRIDFGGAVASEIMLEFERIEELTAQIEAEGAIIRDLNAGLIDFLARLNGRHLYLCWKLGEDRIQFYHELGASFTERRPLP